MAPFCCRRLLAFPRWNVNVPSSRLPDDVRITQERPSLVQSSAWYEEAINKLEQDRRGMCGCTTCHLHLLVKFCDSVGLEVKKVLSFVPHACSQGRIEHDLQDCVDQIKCGRGSDGGSKDRSCSCKSDEDSAFKAEKIHIVQGSRSFLEARSWWSLRRHKDIARCTMLE